MNTAKIDFSAQELSLISNTDFLLTKRRITEKMYDVFANSVKTYSALQVHKNFLFPAGCDFATGKISKGENYNGLPYITLDFPRLFHSDTIFAFRTLFWWGNFFSFTLLLQGAGFDLYKPIIEQKLNTLYNKSIYICINESQWHHHFENDNYIKIEEFKTEVSALPFFKISRKLELQKLDDLEKFGSETYSMFLSALMS